MDVENQEAPQAETIDRRALLEEQLEAAERGEPIEAKPRDESGRFAKPEPQRASSARRDRAGAHRVSVGRDGVAGVAVDEKDRGRRRRVAPEQRGPIDVDARGDCAVDER